MNTNKKAWLGAAALVAVAAGLFVRFGAFAGSEAAGGSVVQISMPSAQSLQLTVDGSARVSGVPSEGQEASFGGLVHNTPEIFDAGMSVGANGTLSVSGLVTGNVGGKISASMSSSATTTACAVLNSSGATRVVTDVGVVDLGTASSLGAVTWTVGTSTASGVTPTAAVNRAVDTTITRLSGRDVITTTSTAQTASYAWRTGEYLVFISGTTTNAGSCYVKY